MKRLIILAASLLMAACQPMPGTAVEVGQPYEPPIVSVPENATSAECASRGGTMQRIGRAQSMQCVVKYADAGKRCTAGSDCQGDCRGDISSRPADGAAAVGQCQADSNPFGCYSRIEGGKAEHAICVD